MPLLIFGAMVVFAPGLVFFLMHLGHVIIEGVPLAGYAMIFLVYLAFTKAFWFFDQPPRIVIPGIMAWGGSILLLLYWLSMPATPPTATATATAAASAAAAKVNACLDATSMLSHAEAVYLCGDGRKL